MGEQENKIIVFRLAKNSVRCLYSDGWSMGELTKLQSKIDQIIRDKKSMGMPTEA